MGQIPCSTERISSFYYKLTILNSYNFFMLTINFFIRELLTALTEVEVLQLLLLFLTWYFIPRVLKLAKVTMYVRNGGDSETVNVLARHTALKC